jgi:hypothetical protein
MRMNRFRQICHERYHAAIATMRIKSTGLLATIVLFKMQCRIFRKRRAVKRVHFFLQVIVGRKKVSRSFTFDKASLWITHLL